MEYDSNKQVTLTKYWNNFNQKKKNTTLAYFAFLLRIFKKKIRSIIGFKINITKMKKIVDPSLILIKKIIL